MVIRYSIPIKERNVDIFKFSEEPENKKSGSFYVLAKQSRK
jgi:hypothetical protein